MTVKLTACARPRLHSTSAWADFADWGTLWSFIPGAQREKVGASCLLGTSGDCRTVSQALPLLQMMRSAACFPAASFSASAGVALSPSLSFWGLACCGVQIPNLWFSSLRDGMSIRAMMKVMEGADAASSMICLVKVADLEGTLLAVFLPFPLRFDAKQIQADVSLENSFVSRLRPVSEAFWWTGRNSMCANVTPAQICIGGDDVALAFDRELRHGRSRGSNSFDSPSLVPSSHLGDFLIRGVELWMLE
eukprot:GHVT01069531.1.p2 GENE.GHVT01069531.1~~GHVT01069531.1.p2  ORF type:complete len:249 (-),score=64.47 GHVT01069531.1:425-1171(-)